MRRRNLALNLLILMVAGCGGGGGDEAPPPPNKDNSAYKVSGTVAGLAGTGLALRISTGETVSISSNGLFSFPTALANGSAYAVTIDSQPSSPIQACSVANGSGIVNGGGVADVTVICVTARFSVGGVVTGLVAQGLQLRLDYTETSGTPLTEFLDINADGNFTFPTHVSDGQSYAVTISQPPSQPNSGCTVGSGSGTVSGAHVSHLTVTCARTMISVGGTVTGLIGQGLELHNNGADPLAIMADGSFVFQAKVPGGINPFNVTVATQPGSPKQTCFVTNSTVAVAVTDYLLVSVKCTATQQFGTSGDDEATAIVQFDGDLYVAGHTTGDFAAANAGGWDGFLMKFDDAGEVQWSKQFGTGGDDRVYDISVNANRETYVLGSTTGTLGAAASGAEDVFIRKYDADGEVLWTQQLGSTAEDVGTDIVGGPGGIFITGHTAGDLPSQISAGGLDLFVAKYDASGVMQWLTQYGSAGADSAKSIGLDVNSAAHVAGATTGNLDGIANANSPTDATAFTMQFDANGAKLNNTKLFCQTNCNLPSISNTTDVRSTFTSISVGLSGERYVAGYMDENSSGSFGYTRSLIQVIDNSNVATFTGMRSYTTGNVAWTKMVRGLSDGLMYVGGYQPDAWGTADTLGLVWRFAAGAPGDSQYHVLSTFGAGSDTRVLALASDIVSRVFAVGRTTGGLDGHTNRGGTDFFLVRYGSGGARE